MKTVTKAKIQKWPMIRVDYCDPTKPDEIITLEGAATRFKLDERDVNSLREGHILGTSVNTASEAWGVDMIHRYTREDSIRDAAEDLLKACELAYKSVVGLPSFNALKETLYNAIQKAERS